MESVVYYLWFERAKLVKIGVTTSLNQLLVQQCQRDCARPILVAVEPGGRAHEQVRHREFATHRVSITTETFWLSDALLAHIDATRREWQRLGLRAPGGAPPLLPMPSVG